MYGLEIWHACCWEPEKVQCRLRSRSDLRFWSYGQKSPFRTDTKEWALGPGGVKFAEWGLFDSTKEVQCRLWSCLDSGFEIAIISTQSYIAKEIRNCWGSEFVVLNKGKTMRFSRISAHSERALANSCVSFCVALICRTAHPIDFQLASCFAERGDWTLKGGGDGAH